MIRKINLVKKDTISQDYKFDALVSYAAKGQYKGVASGDLFFNENKLNAFGSQIRSYVFHPYTMVKDHRTLHETGNGEKVLDGDLDLFISQYLIKLNS